MIEVDPVVHFAELYVANDMIDGGQACGFSFIFNWFISGCERAFVISAVHKDVLGFTIGVDRRSAIDAKIILLLTWCPRGPSAAGRGGLPGFFHIVHFEGDDFYAIAMDHVMRGDRTAGRIRRG